MHQKYIYSVLRVVWFSSVSRIGLGASTSVAIMLDVLKYNFPQYLETWQAKLKEMIPSFDESLAENTELLQEVDNSSSRSLNL